jgi:hypothetical protein
LAAESTDSSADTGTPSGSSQRSLQVTSRNDRGGCIETIPIETTRQLWWSVLHILLKRVGLGRGISSGFHLRVLDLRIHFLGNARYRSLDDLERSVCVESADPGDLPDRSVERLRERASTGWGKIQLIQK